MDVKELLASASPDTIAEALRILRAQGALPRPIFHAITEMVVTPCDEVVPFRVMDGKVYVLLTRREPTDPTWPNERHTPGAAYRPSDVDGEGHAEVHHRILRGELGETDPEALIYVGQVQNRTLRGAELKDVFWTEINHDVAAGEWHPVDELPPDVIAHQRPMIISAAKEFALSKGIVLKTKEPEQKVLRLVPGQPYPGV